MARACLAGLPVPAASWCAAGCGLAARGLAPTCSCTGALLLFVCMYCGFSFVPVPWGPFGCHHMQVYPTNFAFSLFFPRAAIQQCSMTHLKCKAISHTPPQLQIARSIQPGVVLNVAGSRRRLPRAALQFAGCLFPYRLHRALLARRWRCLAGGLLRPRAASASLHLTFSSKYVTLSTGITGRYESASAAGCMSSSSGTYY